MDNKFGKVSRISACAALKDGKTILLISLMAVIGNPAFIIVKAE